jgi:hypothetical protein
MVKQELLPMIRLPLALALFATAIPGMAQRTPIQTGAQAQEETGQPPQRIRNVQLRKGEKCPPPSSTGEVVVCGTLEDPYRIPKNLRESKPDAATQSWVNRAETMDEVGRVAGGLPNTCSPVGTGGQTGCVAKQLRDYAADKRQQRSDAARVPGGER